MPIWKAESVEQAPEVVLASYRIMEDQNGKRYFVGYNLTDLEGRVSTAIQKWDGAKRIGVTSSGRIYKLHGVPGFNADAEHVWNTYKRINKITSSRDVTYELNW